MERSRQQLESSIIRYFEEVEATVEPFLAELVARYVIIAFYEDISKQSEISEEDSSKLLEIAVSILELSDANITAHTVRLCGANISEFVEFQELSDECEQRPKILASNTFKEIYSLFNQDAVYAQLEEFLTQTYRPFSLEENNTELAYSLKISLNSILPRADVLVFRDMLVKEEAINAMENTAEKELLELSDVTAGVSLIGEPPTAALQNVEQSIVILVKEVESELLQEEAVFIESITPVIMYENDTGSTVDEQKQKRLRTLTMYQFNRFALIESLELIFYEISAIYEEFKQVSEQFKDQIQELEQLLQEKESIPKAQIYPKFEHVASLYQVLELKSEQLIRIRTWHARIEPFISDQKFTPLPDAAAANAIFTSEELAESRAWFIEHFLMVKERVESSRFFRLAEQLSDEKCLLKDLTHYRTLIQEQVESVDALFNGADIFLLLGPQNARPGVLTLANTLTAEEDFKFWSQKIVINNNKLDFESNKIMTEKPSSQSLSGNITTIEGHRGPELVCFSAIESKSAFEQEPLFLMAASLNITFASADYLPLIFILDIPRIARLTASEELRDMRESIEEKFETLYFDPLPCVRSRITSDEPCENGIDALAFKNIGGRKIEEDVCGYITRPLYADLTSKYLVSKNLESEMNGEINVFSSGFSIDQILSEDYLQAVSELGSSEIMKQFSTFRREIFKTNSESLLDDEERKVVEEEIRENKDFDYVNMMDCEVQTPLHFYDSNIVPGYTSSEWELRSRALRLFEIEKMRTKSEQTEETTFKCNGETQTVASKDADTQSSHDAYTREIEVEEFVRRPYQDSNYASLLLKGSSGTILRCEEELKIDFDEIEKGADEFRKLRESANQ